MPTVDHPSIIRLAEQARTHLGQAHMALQGTHTLPLPSVLGVGGRATARAAGRIARLDTWAKVAWMPSVVPKRSIYDVAFNHVELPTAELEVRAGRKAAGAAEAKQAGKAKAPASAPAPAPASAPAKPLLATPAPAQPAPAAEDIVMKSADEDEETQDADENDEDTQAEAPKKSGWLSGLWGGRK